MSLDLFRLKFLTPEPMTGTTFLLLLAPEANSPSILTTRDLAEGTPMVPVAKKIANSDAELSRLSSVSHLATLC